MAVVIPIVSEFDGKGLSKAIKEFQQLETTGEKAQFALKKAAVPAAAALAGVAYAIGDATKAAMEDAKAQALLAQAIEKNTIAGEANVRAAEAYIEATMMSAAVADDQLRPALATLVQTTGDLTYSQELLNTALDISAATGTDLQSVTDAVAKAYAGNTKALGNLVPSVRGLIKDGASLDEVMQALNSTVGGAAATAANTAEGRMKRLSLTISETKESIGAAFLPILERLLPVLQNFAVFVQNNTKAVVAVIAVIGTLSAAILALNAVMKVVTATQLVLNLAMAANPIGIVVVALGALAAAFALAWNKSETFRSVFSSVANTVIGYMNNILNGWEAVVNGIIKGINVVISGINKIKPGSDINPIGTITIPTIPGISPGGGGGGGTMGNSGADFVERRFGTPNVVPDIPAIVVPPAAVGGGGGGGTATPGAGGGGLGRGMVEILPIGDLVGGGGGGIGGGLGEQTLLSDVAPINITVNAAIAEATIADKIVDALTEYNRRSGPLQLQIA